MSGDRRLEAHSRGWEESVSEPEDADQDVTPGGTEAASSDSPAPSGSNSICSFAEEYLALQNTTAASGNREICSELGPRGDSESSLARPPPRGVTDVGLSAAAGEGLGCCVALRTLEVQDKRLFAPCRLKKRSGLVGAMRGLVVGRKQESEAGGSHEGDEVVPLSRETELVPAADETVRLTLKPWLRECWKIQGEITTIKEEMDQATVFEALKDVFSNGGTALAAASRLCSKKKKFGDLGDLFDPDERERAMDFATSLTTQLNALSMDGSRAREATMPLQAVVTILLKVIELTKRQESSPVSEAGLSEILLNQDQADAKLLLEAALSLKPGFRSLTGRRRIENESEVGFISLSTFTTELYLVFEEQKMFDLEGGGSLKSPRPHLPSQESHEDLVANITEEAARTLENLQYGRIGVTGGATEHDVTVCYGDAEVTIASVIGVAMSTQDGDTQGAVYLAANLQCLIGLHQGMSLLPKAYRVHPILNSVTTYPSCALKAFVGGLSHVKCCSKIRRAALKDQHGMVFIVADGLLILLNFKTSNACIIAVNGQMLEGASTSSGSVKSVDELLKTGAVEGELEMDISQAEEQAEVARVVSSAQGRDPGEMDEWEGTAKVAAATWLRSTYLVLVGNCWYIRQNPRWKQLWTVVMTCVRKHRITGISVLSAGVTWNTVIIRDRKIVQFLYEKLLAPTLAKGKSWYEVTGSSDIERIVRATAGSIHLSDSVFRLCRSTIEGSIAQAKGIMLSVLGRFSSWHYLYAAGQESETQRTEEERPLHFDYIAEDPHQLGGRALLLLDAKDGYYVRLRNDVISHEQRWFKVMNAPDAPVLDLDGQVFKDDASLNVEERKMARLFDATNRVVSIGAASMSDT